MYTRNFFGTADRRASKHAIGNYACSVDVATSRAYSDMLGRRDHALWKLPLTCLCEKKKPTQGPRKLFYSRCELVNVRLVHVHGRFSGTVKITLAGQALRFTLIKVCDN